MEAVITGEKVIRPNAYKMLFLRGANGKCYITHIDRKMGNSRWWWGLKKGDNLDNLHLREGNIINADFIPKIKAGIQVPMGCSH